MTAARGWRWTLKVLMAAWVEWKRLWLSPGVASYAAFAGLAGAYSQLDYSSIGRAHDHHRHWQWPVRPRVASGAPDIESIFHSSIDDELKEGVRCIIGVTVRHSSRRPEEARRVGGPNAIERTFIRRGKSPPRNEIWHRRTYDLNKELADDLRRNMRIEVGRPLVRIPFREPVGEEEHWM